MASKPANTVQRKFESDMREFVNDRGLGSVYGDEYNESIYEMHHALGRTAKHNKVPIGHEFVFPVPFELHHVLSDHPDNVTHFKHNFTKRFGNQRNIWEEFYNGMQVSGYKVPSVEVYYAIMSTRA
jgi:hypothetical protein